jgi:hypothetical protein
MDKVTYDLYVSMLYLKQSIEKIEKILKEEAIKADKDSNQ